MQEDFQAKGQFDSSYEDASVNDFRMIFVYSIYHQYFKHDIFAVQLTICSKETNLIRFH